MKVRSNGTKEAALQDDFVSKARSEARRSQPDHSLDQVVVALVVRNTKELALHDDPHADRHTLLAPSRGRPEAGRTGRANSARSSAMTLAMSPTVVASPARSGACGTEMRSADDTHGARERKGRLISAPGRLIRVPLVLGTPCGVHNTTLRRLTCLRECGRNATDRTFTWRSIQALAAAEKPVTPPPQGLPGVKIMDRSDLAPPSFAVRAGESVKGFTAGE